MQTIFGYKAALVLTDDKGNELTIPDALGDPTQTGMVHINISRVLDAISDSEARCRFGSFAPVTCGRGRRRFSPPFEDTSVVIEGLYPENGWQEWVTQQDRIWIDRKGNVHLIDKMPKDYCLNVISFLHEKHPCDISPAHANPLIQALRKRVLS